MPYDDIDPSQHSNSPTRVRRLYRTMARLLYDGMRSGELEDPLTEIELALEAAFLDGSDYASFTPALPQRSAYACARQHSYPEPGLPARPQKLGEGDLPFLVNKYLPFIKLALGRRRDCSQSRQAIPDGLVMIMRPGEPDGPPMKAADKWFNCVTEGAFGWSNTAARYLVQNGLFEEPLEVGEGWKISRMTEWGFELFATGRTKVATERRDGGSSTFAEYAPLADDDLYDLFAKVSAANAFTYAPTVSPPADQGFGRRP